MAYQETDWSRVQRHPSTVSPSILEGVRTRDQQAWDRLVHLYGPMVYRQCRGRGIQASDAKNLVQEVFLKVWNGLSTFDRERPNGTFTGWMKTITKNCVNEFYRQRGKQIDAIGGSGIQGLIEASPPPEEDETQECGEWDREVAQRALDLLETDFTGRNVQVFKELVVHGTPTADVAEKYEMTPAAVRQAKARILRRLRTELEGLIDFAESDVLPNQDAKASLGDASGNDRPKT